MRERANKNGWKFVTSAFTDSISKPGIERSVKCLEKLVNEAEKHFGKSNEKQSSDLGLGEF